MERLKTGIMTSFWHTSSGLAKSQIIVISHKRYNFCLMNVLVRVSELIFQDISLEVIRIFQYNSMVETSGIYIVVFLKLLLKKCESAVILFIFYKGFDCSLR